MTRVKICGLRRSEDIAFVNEGMPDYAGMILSPGFRRSLSRETAASLRARLKDGIKMCGVFVNEPADSIVSFVKDGIIDFVQLHGQETEEQIDELHGLLPGTLLIKAFQIHNAGDLKAVQKSHADLVLLDGGTGTGTRFDWSLVRDAGRPFLLAGGLTPENVSQAIRELHPFGVDTSSGVETDGNKDRTRILKFIQMVRQEETG